MLGLHSFMADGTSQGLFIVVAIVILGLFVVMAYILFEDTLSPTLASMFTDATETSHSRLMGYTDIYNLPEKILYYDTGTGKGDLSFTFDNTLFEQDETYKIAFDITLNSGTGDYIGGHHHIASIQDVYIDGVNTQAEFLNSNLDWRYGVPINLIVGETKHVEVSFKADELNKPDGHPNTNVSITVGRYYTLTGTEYLPIPWTEVNATLTNIQLSKKVK